METCGIHVFVLLKPESIAKYDYMYFKLINMVVSSVDLLYISSIAFRQFTFIRQILQNIILLLLKRLTRDKTATVPGLATEYCVNNFGQFRGPYHI